MKESEIIKLAAKIGAESALKTLQHQKTLSMQEIQDKRLRNIKLLLKNYKMFKALGEQAVYRLENPEEEISPLEIIEDLMQGKDPDITVEAIKESAKRTAIIVKHIEVMLGIYKAYAKQDPEEDRRWRVIEALYIADEPKTVPDLARTEYVAERTIYRDIDAACEKLSALMFGIDGMKKG